MSFTLEEHEDAPASWPAPPAGLSARAAAVPPAVVWGRIEGWTGYRWGQRDAVVIAEGPGRWEPRLRPFTIAESAVWSGDAWQTVTLRPTALGGVHLDAEGPYRLTGTLGTADAPAPTVLEAYRRLAEFFASTPDRAAGSSRERVSLGELQIEVDRAPAWIARAIVSSGAADLLRPWRRVK